VKESDLAVATVVTLASWIGYHNSKNRPRFKIRFFNWPLAQFVIDILLVADYWLLATAAGGGPSPPTARIQAGLVFSAFALYVLWDIVSTLIGCQTDKYQALLDEKDRWKKYDLVRSAITWTCAVITGLIWCVSVQASASPAAVYRADTALGIVVVGFRVLKDREKKKKIDSSPAIAATNG
jgi:hypothetical protein